MKKITPHKWELVKQLLKNSMQTAKCLFKKKQLNPKVSWQIKDRYKSYNPVSTRFKLCLNKKLEIIDNQDINFLNKQSKMVSHCCHQNKFKLKTLVSNIASRDMT